MLGGVAWAQEKATSPALDGVAASSADQLHVAIIGVGGQGRNLLDCTLKIPGVRFVAVCDIWPRHQNRAANLLKKYNQPVNVYADYREMLAREKDLDAVIVATPDWMHAEHTVACLQAGKHVYCEKEMAHHLEGARQMAAAAGAAGKLLQIGHQRRSEPRYWHALKLIEKDKVLGNITHFYGQWNRGVQEKIGWPAQEAIDGATLKRFGYESMDHLCNWRWFKKYSGGPIVDLGSHQIDVFGWFLKANPKALTASGGLDYYKDREWYDNVMTIYEYEVEGRTVRGFYQVLNTTSQGNFYEQFMGDEGTLVISEDSRKGFLFREPQARRRQWEDESQKVNAMGDEAIELKIGETLSPTGAREPEGQRLLAESQKPGWQLHLENFFDSVRGKAELTCPPEVAFPTTVAVMKVNEAIAAGRRLEFRSEDFKG